MRSRNKARQNRMPQKSNIEAMEQTLETKLNGRCNSLSISNEMVVTVPLKLFVAILVAQ